jgi:SNF2 family DNA or RNA helicase
MDNARWQNQEEALEFALQHPHVMLDMEMGTGKTRVAIDTVFSRDGVHMVLVVCPKAVLNVWRTNLEKFRSGENWECLTVNPNHSVKKKAEFLAKGVQASTADKIFIVVNYDSVWRKEMGDLIYKKLRFDLIILDESHRAKSAGSKVSKYLAMVGKRTNYRMCLSGTPMANSPLDVYGQYRFLDPSIFGTNHDNFLQNYAILGGPERRFVVGLKNQQVLQQKFQSIAYTCKMDDIKDRLKLPDRLPPVTRDVQINAQDMKTLRTLEREFITECGSGTVVVQNVLVKLLRMQQITSGFCEVQDAPGCPGRIEELNTGKQDALKDLLEDMQGNSHVVVFCVFTHDLDSVKHVVELDPQRNYCELSGRCNNLELWQKNGGVLAVQIQAGAEGVDMTMAHTAIYYSLSHSLYLYEQSKARLYRPGQHNPVTFIHLIVNGTVDEAIYDMLIRKKDIIESVKNGSFEFGYLAKN